MFSCYESLLSRYASLLRPLRWEFQLVCLFTVLTSNRLAMASAFSLLITPWQVDLTGAMYWTCECCTMTWLSLGEEWWLRRIHQNLLSVWKRCRLASLNCAFCSIIKIWNWILSNLIWFLWINNFLQLWKWMAPDRLARSLNSLLCQ